MAEGLLRHWSIGLLEVASAGTNPKPIHPLAIRCLAEAGIDISGQSSKSVERFQGERIDYLITVCDLAKDSCPVFPGATKTLHWSLHDPALAQGSDEDKMKAFRQVREDLQHRIEEFLGRLFDDILQQAEQMEKSSSLSQ